MPASGVFMPSEPVAARHFALFDYGFRPFFLFAGVQATVSLALWLMLLSGGTAASGTMPPILWHGHEMLFGFAIAAVAGFLLTAVPNWTGTKALRGLPLAALFVLWLAGRVAFLLSGVLAPWLVTLLDLAFIPALAFAVGRPLLRSGNRRNWLFIGLMGVLTLANLLVHLELLGVTADSGRTGLLLAIDIVVLMIGVVGGRIVPAFTQTGLRLQGDMRGIPARPTLDRLAIGSLALLAIVDVALPNGVLAGAVALAAAAIHAWRLAGWRGLQTLRQPLLWVLHLGYAWLVVGLALKGLTLLGAAEGFDLMPVSASLHALTVGCAGTMILGVMSRASLGHTGRNLVAPKPVVVAYGLVSLAAIARIVAGVSSTDWIMPALHLAGGLWILAFALFLVSYGPLLVLPRADGKPG